MSRFDGFRRVVRSVLLGSFALAWSVMAISSYFAYTTVGFDFEFSSIEGVDVHYYRLRWDDGSTWIGQVTQSKPRPARLLDWFDPGGTLFDTPTRPVHRSRWNHLGFWRVRLPLDDPYVAFRYPGAKLSVWWACPSWVVLVGFGLPSCWRWMRGKVPWIMRR